MSIKQKMSMKLAALGVSAAAAISGGYLIVPWEGRVVNKDGIHVVYKDAVGINTVCYGMTGKDLYGRDIRMGMMYTEDECVKMLVNTINRFEKQVDNLVKVDYRSDYQKAALISFAYNVGTGNLQTSTLLKKLNAGNHDAACDELSKWVYAKKKKLNGLVSRRSEEKAWCMGQVPYDVTITYNLIIDVIIQTTEIKE